MLGKRKLIHRSDDEDTVESTKPKRRVSRAKPKEVVDLDNDLDGFIVDDEKPASKKRKRSPSSTVQVVEEEVSPPKRGRKSKVATEDKKVEKRKVSGSFRPKWLGPERDPPQHGSKPIPEGKPDCLAGVVFVLTGLNESLTRDEMTELITKYGGYSFSPCLISESSGVPSAVKQPISLQVLKWRMVDPSLREASTELQSTRMSKSSTRIASSR
jgi:singapore isolate B (sub-type 7) whole genome shotgun sequence assembly, scaffold_1